jgi:hypothetical protein
MLATLVLPSVRGGMFENEKVLPSYLDMSRSKAFQADVSARRGNQQITSASQDSIIVRLPAIGMFAERLDPGLQQQMVS